MDKQIYIDCSFGLTRAAVVEDGVLCELIHERSSERKLTETLFLGRVEQIRPSFGAAFIKIGEELNAFLPIDEHHSLRCGEMIIVQGAAKQAVETKGLRVTERINLAGKWLVLVPGGSGVHVSKKVKDASLRETLISIGEKLCPAGCGMIIRTASEEVTEEALKEEADNLFMQWHQIQKKAETERKPCVLNERIPLALRIARDYSGKELSEIVTNEQSCFDCLCLEKASARIPAHTRITFFEEKEQLLFDGFGIEAQIDKALKKRVWLPCGGYLIIEACEALTVIDVNSGKMTLGKNTEDTAFLVNLEASEEIARQLRLRDIGGIVVIDFIDMMQSDHRNMVIDRIKESVKRDRSAVKIEGMTRLGLLELTRKRVNDALLKTHKSPCTYCSGNGLVLSPSEVAMRVLRQVKRMMLSGQRGPFLIKCSPSVASVLSELSSGLSIDIYALPTPSKHAERYDIEQLGKEAPIPGGAIHVKKD